VKIAILFLFRIIWTARLALLFAGGFAAAQGVDNAAPVNRVDGSFVKDWLVLGPFSAKDLETDFLADAGGEANVRPKEGDTVTTKDGKKLVWTRLRSKRNLVNLEQLLGIQNGAIAYAYCDLNSDQSVETDLRAGSFFPASLWLNGGKVGQLSSFLDNRNDLPAVLPIRLEAGLNPCLLKIRNDSSRMLAFEFQPLPPERTTAELSVSDSEGNSIPAALIRIYDKGKPVTQLRTDAFGKASACLFPLAETYDLQITSGEMGAWLFEVALPRGGRQKLDAVLNKEVSISGRVLAMDGSPQNAIVVQAVRVSEGLRGAQESRQPEWTTGSHLAPGENVRIPSVFRMPAFSETVNTGSNGVFRFVNLRPGQYQLRGHSADGYVYPEGSKESLEPIIVEPGRSHDRIRFMCHEIKKGVWSSFPIRKGLTDLPTRSIHRTPDGMLWIGTDHATVHGFDGVGFETFSAPEIPGNHVKLLTHDNKGALWIGSNMGVSRKVDGRIQTLSFSDSPLRRTVSAMEMEPDGTVWFATGAGLAKYDGQTFVMLTMKDGLPSHEISSVSRAKDGALWLGCLNGPSRFDGISFSQPLPLFKADVLHQSRDGAIWICSKYGDRGVYRYDGKTLTRLFQEDGLLSDDLFDIAETSDGVLWFGTLRGLSRFDGTTLLNFTTEDGLLDKEVRSIFVDSDDVLWCATGGGVSRFDPKGFARLTVRDGLKNTEGTTAGVFAIEPDDAGGHWVGTGWGGLFRATRNQSQLSATLVHPHSYVRQIHRADDGTFWFGMGDGLYKQEEGKLVRVLERNWIIALNSDDQGNIWFGHGWSAGGVSRYNPKTREETSYNRSQGLSDDQVWAIERRAGGGMWIGTGAGLALYGDGKMEDLGKKLGVPTGGVFNLRRDAKDTLWIGSRLGLHCLAPEDKSAGLPALGVSKTFLDGYKLSSITASNGLPDEHIWCSARTRDGIIWMGTEFNGLLGYDGQAVTVIDKRDGLPGNQVLAVRPDADGALLLGLLDGGLARFSPTKTAPSVRLIGVKLEDQTVTNFSNIPSTEIGKRVSIQYQEIDLKTHPDKRQFRYRVEGPSGETLYAAVTKERRFDWTPQTGGNYKFEVQAIDRDLNYSKPAGLTFRATVPWYANAWITLPGAGAFCGLLIWGFVARFLYLKKHKETKSLQHRLLAQESQARENLEEKNRQLQSAKEIAESANQAKSTFLANMSHEIRTPLNAVLGYAQILQRDKELAEDQRQAVGAIERSGNHLLSLINEILDLSKIEAGHSELVETEFDLRELILGLSEMFEMRCRQQGLEWRVEWADARLVSQPDRVSPTKTPTLRNMFRVLGDEVKLRQVLINLLGNAVKFTDAGRVTLRVTGPTGAASTPGSKQKCKAQSGESAPVVQYFLSTFTFEIEDTGPGIEGSAQEKIFETFTQGVEGRRKGGTGLGLTISRHQIELMGGELRVQSEMGRGSRFLFSLHLPPASSKAAKADIGRKQVARLKTETAIRALVLDDVAENREILSRVLRELGVEVTELDRGAEAVEELRNQRYDIAFLDIQMPGMTGLEVASRVLAESGAGRAKLVAISASVLKHEQMQYTKEGFDAFIGKPFRLEEICECLEKMLGVTFESDPPNPAPKPNRALEDFDPGLAQRSPLRILVADDYDMNQKIVTRILKGFGYGCDLAANGLEVIQALERKPFDLVFLDVQMPELNGYETARKICQRWGKSERPLMVAMTANALRGDREKCLEAGMDEFISKPVQIEQIRKALEQCQPRRSPLSSKQQRDPSANSRPVQSPQTASAEGPIDWMRLKKMFGADRVAEQQFLAEYLEKTSSLIEELGIALKFGQVSEVEMLAHRGKGASANFGIQAMVEPLERLESAARSTDLSNGPQLLNAIETSFELAVKAVKTRSESVQAE